MKTSDKQLVKRVLKVMMAAPSYVAAAAMKGILAFDGPATAARCKVPALHLAATPPLNPPHLMSEWLPNVVNGWTVGAGHFNMMEVPDQVNAMIKAFESPHRQVLGQVASQTRPEGASDARRTWVYVERRWRPRTKYGDANWPSTHRQGPLCAGSGWTILGAVMRRPQETRER